MRTYFVLVEIEAGTPRSFLVVASKTKTAWAKAQTKADMYFGDDGRRYWIAEFQKL